VIVIDELVQYSTLCPKLNPRLFEASQKQLVTNKKDHKRDHYFSEAPQKPQETDGIVFDDLVQYSTLCQKLNPRLFEASQKQYVVDDDDRKMLWSECKFDKKS